MYYTHCQHIFVSKDHRVPFERFPVYLDGSLWLLKSLEYIYRKIKRLRKIFSTLSDFRDDENPFRNILFRREREEQDIGVRRLAFSREQEPQLRARTSRNLICLALAGASLLLLPLRPWL